MKNAKPCGKCGHDRLLLIAKVADAGYGGVEPMNIATIVIGRTFMGDDKLAAAGRLSATVCRACGKTELYVDDPATIPIDGTYVRELTATE